MALDPSHLSAYQMDALREVGNIGAGNAATSLAEMLGEVVDITVPHASLINTEDIGVSGDGTERIVVGVLFMVQGDAGGIMMYVFPKAAALGMADRLLALAPGTSTEVGEMERSVLGEIGNILTGAFMTALAGFTGLSFDISPPMVAVDTLATIVSEVTVAAAALGNLSLELDTQFVQATGSLEGRFFYLMDEGGLEAILKALGVTE